ncbi:unnamed protein product, partial [Heterosigma akashiwo]
MRTAAGGAVYSWRGLRIRVNLRGSYNAGRRAGVCLLGGHQPAGVPAGGRG